MPELIHAAGGVLWRSNEWGAVEVALVHRPRYDDWTLPKGKRHDGETDIDTAVREVLEETGYRVEVGPQLGESRYEFGDQDKRVRYWAMRAIDGYFTPTHEVDRLEWVSVAEAAQRLTYARDREILSAFIKLQ